MRIRVYPFEQTYSEEYQRNYQRNINCLVYFVKQCVKAMEYSVYITVSRWINGLIQRLTVKSNECRNRFTDIYKIIVRMDK
jgi:hypothetical protein